jgi:hypothetical protein
VEGSEKNSGQYELIAKLWLRCLAVNLMNKQWLFDFAPLILIAGGAFVAWLGIPGGGAVTYVGFAAYGALGLIEVSGGNRKKSFLKILKYVVLGAILLVSVVSMLRNMPLFWALIALILLDRIVLTTARIEVG